MGRNAPVPGLSKYTRANDKDGLEHMYGQKKNSKMIIGK